MLTMAYIGNGKSTNRYHIPFSTKRGNIKIKKIYARKQTSPWEKIAGVTYTNDLTNILEDPEIQLVAICTPLKTHYDLAKQSLLAGKNVLLEKPFTETSQQAKELFQLAKEKGLFLQAYQNRRFDSDFLTVQTVIKSGVLGDILEVEMHYDYFRPEIPLSVQMFSLEQSYLYGHGCHTIDQVISFFGFPDAINYDVRQLLGKGRMNDYFDIDMYFGQMKVSVKSSYFRLKERPSFIVYGTQGVFVKETKDRQEEDLKHFYMPNHSDFGIDKPENYGTLTYMDKNNVYHEEKVVSEIGDYSRLYQGVYDTIIHGAEKLIKDEETIQQIEILEAGIETIINE
ncbi:Gfo/Idh/MocA family oxidoreductase [Enterococcus sp. LJL99]